MCGVMILGLGIMLASASFSPYFTHMFSILVNAAYPFVGAFSVSRDPQEAKMGWR